MQRIFAADIGGTNARFALFSESGGDLALLRAEWTKSVDLATTDDVLQAMQQRLQLSLAAGDILVVALAGPVRGQQGKLTNGALRVDLQETGRRYGLSRCLLVNDFFAQAFATLTPAGLNAMPVRDGCCPADSATATRAVLGAGTGLGAASLVRCRNAADGCWLAVPSESGHMLFPFVGAEEHAYQDFLARELGRSCPTAENVLCGEGLALLQYYLTGRRVAPPAAGQALARETPTLQWYARFWGRFCRQWMLSTVCSGGLWLAGGIAAKNPLCVTHPAFAQELGAGADAGGIVAAAPIYLITDGNSGLWGAARAAV